MTHPQSFTPLQSRRLPQTVLDASLCPSMDLIALSLGGGRGGTSTAAVNGGGGIRVATSISVHRTVSWQKLLSVQKSDLTSQGATDADDDDDGGFDATSASAEGGDEVEAEDSPPSGASALCWSPDGRTVALGLADGGLALFDVEASTDGGGKGGGGGGGGSGAARYVPPVPFVPPVSRPREGGGVNADERKGGAGTDAPAGGRDMSLPAICATSPAMTRSRAAAMRRQQGGSNTEDVRGGGSKMEAVSHGWPEVVATERSESPDLGWRRGAVIGLVWARVGPKHRLWELDEEEEEKEEFWRHRSHYLDRSKYFLPPCDYSPRPENEENQPHHHDSSIGVDDTGFSTMDKSRPTSVIPLSVLCASTCANGLHLYLHGRYRLLSIPPTLSVRNIATDMVCTSDLGTILLSSKTTSPAGQRLAIYSIPPLSQNRYDLQQISALYCSTTAHLQTMRKGMASASASWTGALRPLDAKFQALAKLLRDYGVLDAATAGDTAASAAGVRAQLLRFALEGHSSQNGDASNAMDQFFAAATMNDQLLLRLERTLEANVAGVEGTLRKSVLGPVRSLVHDAHELRGLASAMGAGRTTMWDDGDSDDDDSCVSCAPLLDIRAARSLCDAAESLFEIMERCLSMLVDARFRLRDVMKWIRGTASQVKARGTAVDSVMRENARKRRVPDSVIKRVASFLSSDPAFTSPEKKEQRRDLLRNANMTEQVLGVPLSVFFSEDESPPRRTFKSVSALSALSTSSHLAADLFDQPRSVIADTVERIDIIQPFCRKENNINCSFAVHRRVGAGIGTGFSNAAASKCFSPNVSQDEVVDVAGERHWTLVAYTGSSGSPTISNSVEILAIPTRSSFEDGKPPQFFLLSSILLPNDVTVSDLHFYGDDGCSSLSSESDAQGHEEGRQALGLLIERVAVSENADNSQEHSVSEELWIMQYDDLSFTYFRCGAKSIQLPKAEIGSSCNIAITGDGALVISDDQTLTTISTSIKRRQIRERASFPINNGSEDTVDKPLWTSKLVLSGSRGIGGVVSSPPYSLDLFDLEEDEENDDVDQSGSFDDNNGNMSE